ncbi:MAG: shikimate kinase [Desulfobulbaceae bacterium]|nr:shikimate kinase [Desulfobulbaceae bacterium]
MANNILLIGFMGVGKGRLARELAARTGYFILDTDDLIESFENTKIKKIFKNEGESYFRNLEQKVGNWLELHVSNTIISTGGGFFAVENLDRIGTVVFLKSDFETILSEMLTHPNAKKRMKKRPLFQDPKQAEKLFNTRQPLYTAKANIIIDVAGRQTEDIANEITTNLNLATLSKI